MAKIKSKTVFAGSGSLVQLVGVATAVMGTLWFGDMGLLVGGVLGLMLLIVGSSMSKYLFCSNCGNRLDGRHVKMCPTCKEAIE